MSITIQVIDIIIIIGICQGIFLSLGIQRISNNNKKANSILSILLLLATLMLAGRFLYVRFFSEVIFQWSLLFDAIVFLFGLFLFTYIKRLLVQNNVDFKSAWIDYLPFVTFTGIALYFIIEYTPEAYFSLYRAGKLRLFFHVVVIMGIVCNSYYVIKSFVLLSYYKKSEERRLSLKNSQLRYIYFILMAFSVTLVAWIFAFINYAFLDRYFTYINYDSVWILIPVFVYIIGYFSLKQPELFRIQSDKSVINKKDRISKTDADLLKFRLNNLMLNDKLFLQNDLTLTDVAEKLNTTTNNISWLINNIYENSFYDFINQFRIEEFVRKIDNKEHIDYTILAMSMDVGFNSKSTFNKAFKQSMKDTPSNFIKKRSVA